MYSRRAEDLHLGFEGAPLPDSRFSFLNETASFRGNQPITMAQYHVCETARSMVGGG